MRGSLWRNCFCTSAGEAPSASNALAAPCRIPWNPPRGILSLSRGGCSFFSRSLSAQNGRSFLLTKSNALLPLCRDRRARKRCSSSVDIGMSALLALDFTPPILREALSTDCLTRMIRFAKSKSLTRSPRVSPMCKPSTAVIRRIVLNGSSAASILRRTSSSVNARCSFFTPSRGNMRLAKWNSPHAYPHDFAVRMMLERVANTFRVVFLERPPVLR